MEKELIYNGRNRNNIVELWHNCIINLNNKNTKF